MKSLGAFLVVSCAAVGVACSGDSFEPAPPSGNAGAAGQSGAGAAGSAGGSGTGTSGDAGSSAGGSSAGQSTGGAAGSTIAPGGAGGDGGGTGGGGDAAGNAGNAAAAGSGGNAGKSGSGAGGAGAAGTSGKAGAAGKSGGSGAAGKAGGAGSGGQSGQAGSSGAGGGPESPAFVPSNTELAGTFGDDLSKDVNFANGGSFDTGSDCSGASPLGSCEQVKLEDPTGVDPAVTACVCRIAGNLKLVDAKLIGGFPLILLVNGDATINGVVRVLSGNSVPAEPSTGAPTAGGTFGSVGGRSKLKPRGEPSLIPLATGQDGQAANDKPGGRGGGALQLSVRGTLTIPSTGRIDAGGQPGSESAVQGIGPGGGSGGAILVEASTLTLQGAVVANGASGTGGGATKASGQPGVEGSPNATPAEGGLPGSASCTVIGGTGNASGGRGGKGAASGVAAGEGDSGTSANGCLSSPGTISGAPGGGGGGVGRIRIRSRSMKVEGTVSPSASQESIPNP